MPALQSRYIYVHFDAIFHRIHPLSLTNTPCLTLHNDNYAEISLYIKERIAPAMKNSARCISLCLASLFAILLFASLPTFAAPHLTGTYKITEITDLGSEIRFSVELNLLNPSEAAVTVSRVSLHSISAPGQLVSASSKVVVGAHSSSQVALEFVIGKTDFSAWMMGPHQHFIVTLQPSSGKVSQVSVLLLRTQG
jgi:hypothetical protein